MSVISANEVREQLGIRGHVPRAVIETTIANRVTEALVAAKANGEKRLAVEIPYSESWSAPTVNAIAAEYADEGWTTYVRRPLGELPTLHLEVSSRIEP